MGGLLATKRRRRRRKTKRKAILLVRSNERPETFYLVAGKNVNESGQCFLRNDAAMSNDRLHDLWSDLALVSSSDDRVLLG